MFNIQRIMDGKRRQCSSFFDWRKILLSKILYSYATEVTQEDNDEADDQWDIDYVDSHDIMDSECSDNEDEGCVLSNTYNYNRISLEF